MLERLILVFLFIITFPNSLGGTLQETRIDPMHDVLEEAGSPEGLLLELQQVARYASDLRHGIPCVIEEPKEQGWSGVVSKITFSDGLKWAAKLMHWKRNIKAMVGVNALTTLETYCPEIPAPRVHGSVGEICEGKLKFYLMDWIDGIPLNKSPGIRKVLCGPDCLEITVPEHFISQFAEFVFNLTTCPFYHAGRIPADKRG